MWITVAKSYSGSQGEGMGGGERSVKLKLPPFYKVNGKLKRGLLKH